MLALLINLYVVSDTSKSIDVVGEDVRIESVVDGDVSVVRGNLDILGRVRGDVDVVSGNVHLFPGSVVEGDVSVVGGDLILDSGAVVEGDVALVAGSLENNGGMIKGEVQKVSGTVLNMLVKGILDNTLKVVEEGSEESEKPSRRYYYSPFYLSGILGEILGIIILFAILGIFFLILKKFILRMADTIEEDLGRAILFGIISYILIVPVLLLLVVSIVGILLIPVYLVGVVMAFFIALDAGMVYVGRLVRRNLDRDWSEWMDFIAGFSIALVLKAISILVSLIPVDICCFKSTFALLYGVYLLALSILGFGALFKWIFRID